MLLVLADCSIAGKDAVLVAWCQALPQGMKLPAYALYHFRMRTCRQPEADTRIRAIVFT